jgi:AcrR family transcriptional regulator
VHSEEGLRERKRRETRALISGTAMRLFMERGFDQVSITEIAAAAGVAEKTVYNYFPAKAEMFFDEASDVLAELLAAVRYRAAGQSAVEAVGTFIAGRAEWAAGRRPE